MAKEPAERSCYPHIEPSRKSQQRLRQAVRVHLNHWTQHRRIDETITGLNRLLRGWSGYFHFGSSSRVFGKLDWWLCDRIRRWLWRKHGQSKALWSDYPDELLRERYGLWPLPLQAAWKRR